MTYFQGLQSIEASKNFTPPAVTIKTNIESNFC